MRKLSLCLLIFFLSACGSGSKNAADSLATLCSPGGTAACEAKNGICFVHTGKFDSGTEKCKMPCSQNSDCPGGLNACNLDKNYGKKVCGLGVSL